MKPAQLSDGVKRLQISKVDHWTDSTRTGKKQVGYAGANWSPSSNRRRACFVYFRSIIPTRNFSLNSKSSVYRKTEKLLILSPPLGGRSSASGKLEFS
jgi:hypothetical protein